MEEYIEMQSFVCKKLRNPEIIAFAPLNLAIVSRNGKIHGEFYPYWK